MKKLKKPYATFVILAVCVLIQAAITFTGGDNETETAILFGAYYKALIMAGEYWRVLTCGLVHITIWHLFVNALSLMNIGTVFEQRFGILRYLLILFGSVIGGSLFMFALEGNTVAVGLSGGLYGLMGGYIVIVMANGSYKRPDVISQLIRVVLINLMINFMPGVAVSAHIGGFLFGMVITALCLKDYPQFRRSMAVCGIVLLVMTGWFVRKGAVIREDQKYLMTDLRVLATEKHYGFSGHAFRMAANLDKIYGYEDMLTSMLEVTDVD